MVAHTRYPGEREREREKTKTERKIVCAKSRRPEDKPQTVLRGLVGEVERGQVTGGLVCRPVSTALF